MKWCKQLLLAVVVTALAAAPAFAQGGTTSSITGTVTDSGGGVIPGATVVVTTEMGTTYNVVTNAEGVFSVPALQPGTYKVTVSLQGFKTAVVENVRVIAGNPSNVSVKLEIGQLQETVTVRSSTELVNTQNATVSSTLNADQLNRMPTASRNALNAVTFLPGVNTAGVNRNSTVNGLPESMLNITLDGVSNQDNFLKTTDGFFASVYPRQDAVEAVTVTTAVAGANLGGSGAVTINFTTRSGTNRLSGSAYEYWRDPSLNTNYWFNERNGLGKNQIKLNQYGLRLGGPIKIPGLFDGSGKAFYFFHYEELRFPNSFTRTRSIMNPATLDGTFLYSNGTRSVNVMSLAAANPGGVCGAGPNACVATFDPEVIKLLNLINDATKKTGVVSATTDPMEMSYVWQVPGKLLERQPTTRIDFNLTTKHRLSGSASSIWASRDPDYLNSVDQNFPGAPNYRVFRSTRPLYSITLRSTLSSSLVNELKGGITAAGGSSRFGQPTDPSIGPESFADIGGYAVVIPFTTDWWRTNNPSWRAVPTFSIDDSVSWQVGKHSLNFGGGWLLSSGWEAAQQIVPVVNLGMVNTAGTDPAIGLFNTTNFPGATNTDLSNARAHFAQLTGRISSITNQVALDPATNQYVPNGPRKREGKYSVWSLYAQDSWRMTPTVTLSGGLRWDLQTPFEAINDTMSAVTFDSICGISGRGPTTTPFDKCAFYSRANTGVVPEFIQLTRNTKGYETDWNNVAPSISMAWRPNVQSGWLRTILGDPEQATLRGGYSVSFERQGLSTYTGRYGSNPGSTLGITRSDGNQNLVNTAAGETWPLLYSQKNRLYNASFPATVAYPIAVRNNRDDDLFGFAEDIEIGHARSWTIGFQRSITRDMAVEIRYVGTRGVDQWSSLNYNARDLEGNGFIDEFKLAVANLRANNEAGGNRVGSFAYFGPGTGTNPLPTYLAYLSGKTGAGNCNSVATCQTLYSGSDWTSTALTGDLIFHNPSPGNSAADLDGNTTRRNRAASLGLDPNLFVLNPHVDEVNVLDSGAFSDYHALQIDMRRRLSQGLSASLNYQYAREGGSAFDGFRYGRTMVEGANVRHAIKTQWDWTIPVGRGQRYGTDMNPWMDGLVGGWSFRGVGRIQARTLNFGNVNLVGMTAKELQELYKFDIRTDPANGLKTVYMMPDDVILNTRRAFSLSSSTTSGYGSLGAPEGRYIAPANYDGCIQIVSGDCAPRTLLIRAPFFTRFDVGLSKRFGLRGSGSIEVAFEVLNVLDNINFNPTIFGPDNSYDDARIFQVTSAYQDTSNTYDPGGRLGQLMFRISW